MIKPSVSLLFAVVIAVTLAVAIVVAIAGSGVAIPSATTSVVHHQSSVSSSGAQLGLRRSHPPPPPRHDLARMLTWRGPLDARYKSTQISDEDKKRLDLYPPD
jgi:hypothetical protein